MMFVVRSVRYSGPVRPKRSTVSVSSSPSRMDAAAPGCSSSSDQRLAAGPASDRHADSRAGVLRRANRRHALR